AMALATASFGASGFMRKTQTCAKGARILGAALVSWAGAKFVVNPTRANAAPYSTVRLIGSLLEESPTGSLDKGYQTVTRHATAAETRREGLALIQSRYARQTPASLAHCEGVPLASYPYHDWPPIRARSASTGTATAF